MIHPHRSHDRVNDTEVHVASGVQEPVAALNLQLADVQVESVNLLFFFVQVRHLIRKVNRLQGPSWGLAEVATHLTTDPKPVKR